MKNELQLFAHPDFGEIRMVTIDGKPYAVARDVAKALGYVDATNAIKQHCRWVAKHHLPHPQSPGKKIVVNVVPEGDMYRLAAHLELPGTERFESWIYDEVLPTIRKTGSYIAPTKRNLSETNTAAKIILPILKAAGIKVSLWLQKRNYPTSIVSGDKSFAVNYRPMLRS